MDNFEGNFKSLFNQYDHLIRDVVEPVQILAFNPSYSVDLYRFFKYVLHKFLNPQKMKTSSIHIIKNIFDILLRDKSIIFINIAIYMFDFALKIKGDKQKNLIGFFDCNFIGSTTQDIKLDFVIKFSEFMSLYSYNYNYIFAKYYNTLIYFGKLIVLENKNYRSKRFQDTQKIQNYGYEKVSKIISNAITKTKLSYQLDEKINTQSNEQVNTQTNEKVNTQTNEKVKTQTNEKFNTQIDEKYDIQKIIENNLDQNISVDV